MLILAQGELSFEACGIAAVAVIGTLCGTFGCISALFHKRPDLPAWAKPPTLLGVWGILCAVLLILGILWYAVEQLSDLPFVLRQFLILDPLNLFIAVPLGLGSLSIVLGVVRRNAVPLGEKWLFIPGIAVLLLIAGIIYAFVATYTESTVRREEIDLPGAGAGAFILTRETRRHEVIGFHYEKDPDLLTASKEVRWSPDVRGKEVESLLLDAIDLRPKGAPCDWYWSSLYLSPDSKHFAAICANSLVVIDPKTHRSRRWHYDNQYFGSMAWLSNDEIAYVTLDLHRLTFWRHKIQSSPDARVKIYQESAPASGYEEVPAGVDKRPPQMRWDVWSPNGRFVIFRRRLPRVDSWRRQAAMLDIDKGIIVPLCYGLNDVSWRRDSTAVLVFGITDEQTDPDFHRGMTPYDGRFYKMVLVETRDLKVTDLTAAYHRSFGRDSVSLGRWTADGQHVGCRRWVDGKSIKYLIRPKAWRVVRTGTGPPEPGETSTAPAPGD